MKKSSLVLVALLLTAPVFADEAQAEATQPLTLASADTSISTNLKVSESGDLIVGLDKEIKEFSDALSAKIDAQLSADIAKETASAKF